MGKRNNLKMWLITLILLVSVQSSIATGEVIYVDDDALPGGDGQNWTTAYKYLQDALADANTNFEISEIWVAEGTYTPDCNSTDPNGSGNRFATFQLINGVALYGGFPAAGGTWEHRDPNVYETILSGDLYGNDDIGYDTRVENSYQVVTGSWTDETAILDGFTITAGGGGMYNYEGSPTVTNCIFSGNAGDGMYNYESNLTVSNCTFNGNGDCGMYNYESNPTVTNCIFSDNYYCGMLNANNSPTLTNCKFIGNRSHSSGGGMWNHSSSPIVTNCTFTGNSVDDYGGGMCNNSSSPTLTNCTFTGNSAQRDGGGMYNINSRPKLTNCTFSGNSAYSYGERLSNSGGGMCNYYSSNPTLTNCTFSGNEAKDYGGGIYNEYSSSITVTNCIIWGNSAYIDGDQIAIYSLHHPIHPSTLKISHSDLEGGLPAVYVTHDCSVIWGTGNIDTNPLFVDADGIDNVIGTEDDNLRLLGGSLCIDAGNNDALPVDILDLDGDGDANEPLPFDLDSKPRFLDDPFIPDSGNPGLLGLPIVDIGAYEGAKQGFLLSSEMIDVPEEQTATFTVALAMDPNATVEATVVVKSGDSDIVVQSGALLIFNSSNYWEPQTVTVAADEDIDRVEGTTTIGINGDIVPSVEVIAWEIENDVVPVLFVDSNAIGADDGASWQDAFNYLQDALALARGAPRVVEEIRVAQGIYTPDSNSICPEGTGDRQATFQLINDVALKGGYAGFCAPDPNERDIELFKTILSGDLDGNDVQVSEPCDLYYEPTRAENSYNVVTGSGTDAHAVLDGFIVKGGNANIGLIMDPDSQGGGMYNRNGSPKVINCTFSGNSAYRGGGVCNYGSNPIMTNCTFSENSANFAGGGINNLYKSNPTLVDCMFNDNWAYYDSGGMDNIYGSNPSLANCTFSSNSAHLGGGMCNTGSSPTLNNCTFSRNSALGVGGGMYNVSFYSNPLLTNCTFSGNAAVLGGGMCNRDGCSPMLSDCTFSGNKAREGGGMLNSYRSNPILANCTLSGNWADFGGGIYNHGSTSDVTNCIIWNNSAETDGDQIALALFYGMSSDYVSTLMVSYSDLEGGLPAVYFDPNCSVIWGIGNIDVDPCFVEPGYWDDNKTPEDANDDFWIDGDYHLQSEGWRWDSMRERWDFDSMTSRCIDAGNPGSPIGEEMLSVPNDPNNEYGVNLRINMGAYGGTTEASMSPHDWALLADLTNDGKVTLDDVGAQTEDWLYKSNDLPGDLDRNGIVDMYDFALFAQDWSEQTLWFQP